MRPSGNIISTTWLNKFNLLHQIWLLTCRAVIFLQINYKFYFSSIECAFIWPVCFGHFSHHDHFSIKAPKRLCLVQWPFPSVTYPSWQLVLYGHDNRHGYGIHCSNTLIYQRNSNKVINKKYQNLHNSITITLYGDNKPTTILPTEYNIKESD